jgi:uncharacterized protein (TIGR02118 family)
MNLLAIYSTPENEESFLDNYFNGHLPLIKKIPGLLDVDAQKLTRTLVGEKAPFMVVTMRFADKDAAKIALNSPEMSAAGENLDGFARGMYTLSFSENKE